MPAIPGPVASGDRHPYCWPETECLRNKLGLRDAAELEDVEQQVVGLRYLDLATNTLPGAYDTDHLRRFHRTLFGEIYPWAGEIRTVNLQKPGTAFCLSPFIEEQLAALFSGLAAERHYIGRTKSSFVESFAALYGELNAIHPFREGNGRAQRAFLRQLAASARWTVYWERLERASNDEACRQYSKSFEPDRLIDLLSPVIEPRPTRP